MTAKPYHHGNLRNTLLQAARLSLRTTPPEELSLRQLARDTGVSANAPYRHFHDRDALLSGLALDGFGSLVTLVQQRTGGASPTTRLQELSKAYLEFATAEPGLFRLMFRKSEARSEAITEAAEVLFAEILSALEATHPEDDPEASLRRGAGVWAAIHGTAVMHLDGTLDWLDDWLRPGAAEVAMATRAGFSRTANPRGVR